jgi:hypothetical protein
MPVPLVVPGIARYTLKAKIATIPIVTILDMHVVTGSGDRAGNVFDCAGNIINQWYTHLRGQQVNEYVLESVDYIDLDSPTGVVGSRTITSERTLPLPGADAGGPLPSFVAGLVKKSTSAARGAKTGRLFFPGLPEPITDVDNPNTISAAALTSLNNSLAAFLTAINVDAGVGGAQPSYTGRLAVVHKPAVGATFHTDVTGLSMQSRLTYQTRRRQ